MNGLCLIGYHRWRGCQCLRCGEIRDEGHDWDKNCEKCATCGKTRSGWHAWVACKCSTCGTTRDEGHDWSKDCERCSWCGQAGSHAWVGCECSQCGKTADVILWGSGGSVFAANAVRRISGDKSIETAVRFLLEHVVPNLTIVTEREAKEANAKKFSRNQSIVAMASDRFEQQAI